MAANTTLNTGTGGDVIRTIDRSGTGPKTQVAQIDVGGGGATETLVSTAAPMPVRIGDGTNQITLEQPSVDGEAATAWNVPTESYLKVFNGTTWDRARGDTTSGLWVNVKNAAVTIQGVQDTATTGTITTAASTVGPLAVTQRNVITITVSGTYAGVTFVIEASDDGGTTYYPLQCINNATGQAASTWTPGTNASASYDSAVGGYTHLRVRSTAWTSGTANVRMTAQSFAYDPVVAALSQGLAASGSAVLGNPVLMGGSDGTNARSLRTDANGNIGTVQAARTAKMFTVSALAATATTETGPVTYTISSGLAATTTGTTYTVTTGKTLRIQQIVVCARNSTGTTASPATVRIRAATSGTITTTSPLQCVVVAGTPASAQETFGIIAIPDGFDLPSASTMGITIQQSNWVTASVVCTFDITVIGYEY